MAKIQDLLDALERVAPERLAFSFDRVGLQVGDPGAALRKGVVSLDRSLAAVAFAQAEGADVLLAHHPLIFEPLASVDARSHVGRTVLALAGGGTAFIAAHTNWDCATGGINDALAKALGVTELSVFGLSAQSKEFKLTVTCLESDAEAVIDAASGAGAGVVGTYSRCAFTVEGEGTFRAGKESNPTVGAAGGTERVREIRIEMVLPSDARRRVERAVRAAHSYEEPAIDFFELASRFEQPSGRLGLVQETTLEDFSQSVSRRLGTSCLTWGDPRAAIRKVALVGGAADGEWRAAMHAGADVLVTGEVKQHVAVEATESGMNLIAAGHYATEQPGCVDLKERLEVELPGVSWTVFEPGPGSAGRPF